MTPDRPDWTATIEVPVTWADMDAFGHVNNAIYFRYFESSRIDYLTRIGWFDAPGAPSGNSGPGVILHSVHARFRRPVTYPDSLLLSSRLAALHEDRFTLEHEVWSTRLSDVVAEGSGIIVAYDYNRREKSRIPDDIRERIAALEENRQT
jgi:acyl-CoA thioester hydrolase